MGTINDQDILEYPNATAWESWLEKNSGSAAGGIWLKIAKKGSGKNYPTIAEAGEIALCFGWIDSQRKSFDQDYYLQRYSPRKPKSPWSKINRERAEKLIAAGKMRPGGLAEINAARLDGRWELAYPPQSQLGYPQDFYAGLSGHITAKTAFDSLNKTDRYAIVLPILKATDPVRRLVSIAKALQKLESLRPHCSVSSSHDGQLDSHIRGSFSH